MQNVKIDRLLRGAIGLLMAALVYVIYAGIHQTVIAAGDAAPGFTITADNGRAVSASNFGGKVLILNFWATWCPPCVEETPSLSQFAQEFANKGVVVLGVSVDTDEKAYRAFLRRFNPAFLTARDDKIHKEYGTFVYPETYIIDSNGKVVQKIPQQADWSDPRIAQFVNSLL